MGQILSSPDITEATRQGPRHISIIMDGNNRWAKAQGLPGVEGHRAGAKTLRSIVEAVARSPLEALTVFAFSSENWRRPPQEVEALMTLFVEALDRELPDLHRNGIRLRFIGELSAFNAELRVRMDKAVNLTENNTAMTLVVAVNYGGRWDITNTAKKICQQVKLGHLDLEDINERLFDDMISLHGLPPVDICIRTGGEQRVSNFLLWQIAYAELYFTDKYWPDFSPKDLAQVIAEFNQRQRRFGRTGDQVQSEQSSDLR